MSDPQEKRLTGAEQVFWDLSVYFNSPDDPHMAEVMHAAETACATFAKTYKGRVASLDAEELREAMETREELINLSGQVSSYAGLLYSTDTVNPQYGALLQKVTEWDAQMEQQTLFFTLEWNQIPDETAHKLLSHPVLAKWQHKLSADRRFKPHQLSEIEEQLLVEKAVTGSNAWTRFFTQLIAAIRADFDGQPTPLTPLLTKLHNPDREVRRKAAEAITSGLRGKAMELAYIFNILGADKAIDDKRRHYSSWVASRNLDNKAPDAVVEALVESVTKRYDLVQRHYRLKRKLLGLESLADYDRYAPLPLKTGEHFYTWDEAKQIVLNAFQAFHPRMAEVAQLFFDQNWIHAPAMPGKRGGAFCSYGIAAQHPFVFLNYEGTARDVMTLAHELGHGIHAYLSGQAHGNYGMYTPLTTAEMASTFAEMLVFSDLIARETDSEARLALLAHKIEDSFATIFRQISMNRFEEAFHTARRTEGELRHERISALWLQTQSAVFGDSVQFSQDYGFWWSYIPHFLHTPGYVYAYAFGELLVLALYNLYLERGAAFAPEFLAVLTAGDTDYPAQILAKVGVDLNDLSFWNEGLNSLERLIAQEEALAQER